MWGGHSLRLRSGQALPAAFNFVTDHHEREGARHQRLRKNSPKPVIVMKKSIVWERISDPVIERE
jgi:hypothetical protein